MSNNIVNLIMAQCSGGAVNKIGSLLGESPDRTQSALGAAVPTLLAGLTHVASTPEGAQRLSSAIGQQDPAVADNFAASIPSSPGSYNPQTGSNLVSNLFGGSLTGGITSALSRFTGMKSGGISSLLGLVAPLALGSLGKQQRSMGLDASGLAGYLNGQKQNITAAMPSGLSNALSGIPGFGGFAQKAPAEPEVSYAGASPAYTGTSAGTGRAYPEPVKHASPTRWLVPLLLAAILAWGFWSWSRHRQTVQQPVNQPTMTTGAYSVSQITDGLRNTITSGTTTLSGITDATSAQQALPQINQLNDQLATYKAQMDKLPASAKATVSSTAQPWIASLRDQSAKARNVPGAGQTLQPALDKLDANLASFTTSP